MTLLNTGTMCITVAVAAGNLTLAGISGNVLPVLRHPKLILIFLIYFLFQVEMLIVGKMIAIGSETMLYSTRHWIALSFLGFIALMIIADILKNKNEFSGTLQAKEILRIIFSTSLYILLLGWSFRWLGIHDPQIKNILMQLLLLFLVIGLLLGKWHYNRALKILRWVEAVLIIAGTVILFFVTI